MFVQYFARCNFINIVSMMGESMGKIPLSGKVFLMNFSSVVGGIGGENSFGPKIVANRC